MIVQEMYVDFTMCRIPHCFIRCKIKSRTHQSRRAVSLQREYRLFCIEVFMINDVTLQRVQSLRDDLPYMAYGTRAYAQVPVVAARPGLRVR